MKKVIVLIGRISSGKDHAGDFLAQRLGAKHVGISSSLRIVAREKGVAETRENLIAIGKELTEKYGDGYLAEVLLQREESEILIISGVRQVGQITYLQDNSQAHFVAIESSEKTRYQRMLQRGKIGEDISFVAFQKIEQMEEGKIQNVGKCLKYCDIAIENNLSIEVYEEKLESYIQKWKNIFV